MPLFPRKVLSYKENEKKLKTSSRSLKGTLAYPKQRHRDLKRPCRDIKKIIWMKRRLSNHKRCNKAGVKAGVKAASKTAAEGSRSKNHLFLRKQLGKITKQKRIKKAVVIVYQEGGRRSKKILQS